MGDGDGSGNSGDGGSGSGGGSGFTAITSQEEFDKAISDRIGRERAKFADYDAIKAKATKFDENEDKAKSEVTKALERATKAEQDLANERLERLRATVAADKGVPASNVTGTTKEEMEASADALVGWRDQNKRPPRQPKDLKSGSSGGDDANKTGKERAAAALRDYRRGA